MNDDVELKRMLNVLPKEIRPPQDEWPAIRARLRKRRGVGAPFMGAPAFRIAALLALLAVAAGALMLTRADAGRWTLASATTEEQPLEDGARVASGSGALRLTVGNIGTVDVDPNTEGRLIEGSWSAHRFHLARGVIHARIDAPPRLFVVETPAGVAVDLGCAYTLEVDSAGTSHIHVTAGWVSFEYRGHAPALIPAGWRAEMKGGGRLGTPVRDSAGAALRQAVALFDSTRSIGSLRAVIEASGREDAVTLWHLVGRTLGAEREVVVDRLMQLVPPPEGIRRQALLATDPVAMELYWTALPGTLPIIPAWRQALWRAWLRVAG